ncbi:hypothetical protein N3K66_008877 [Trichothecium roseum]|uniref:Uncharacterized protein n=1 Tax=Trichothecium roseum TaxID=47278 RepID=A0ACC0URG3_9HYPO|nr:hypothetical protein N3K66_008877 [Trichothecium roseum]
MDRRRSVATSDTTYHSFSDADIVAPASPPRKRSPRKIRGETSSGTGVGVVVRPEQAPDSRPPTAYKMKRQDSGYESNTTTTAAAAATPRTSLSSSRVSTSRRTSSASIRNPNNSSTATSGGKGNNRTRPTLVHRSTRTSAHYPQACCGSTSRSSLYLSRPSTQHAQTTQPQPQAESYFQFPPLDPHHPYPSKEEGCEEKQQEPSTPPIPQTTHYWTSDRTRRLEYAAIDAAQRGFTGWLRRNLVPDCLVPQDGRVVGFDDDTGSVRRYRLELDDEDEDGPDEKQQPEQKKRPRRRTWHFWA